MVITSLENEKIKNYAKLKDKKYRDITNTFIVEGFHLVQEAFKKAGRTGEGYGKSACEKI